MSLNSMIISQINTCWDRSFPSQHERCLSIRMTFLSVIPREILLELLRFTQIRNRKILFELHRVAEHQRFFAPVARDIFDTLTHSNFVTDPFIREVATRILYLFRQNYPIEGNGVWFTELSSFLVDDIAKVFATHQFVYRFPTSENRRDDDECWLVPASMLIFSFLLIGYHAVFGVIRLLLAAG